MPRATSAIDATPSDVRSDARRTSENGMPTADINRSLVSERIGDLSRDAPMRVLVVDDDELECALLSDRLSSCGLQITEATSGATALELLTKQWFPIVLTDWQMPGMDGIELTERLRALGVDDTYIIMLTVLDSEFDYERGYRAGVDDYLSKKMPITEVISRVHGALSTLELRRALKETRAALAEAHEALAAAGIDAPGRSSATRERAGYSGR
jgi:CheY-like chemotaxis protein